MYKLKFIQRDKRISPCRSPFAPSKKRGKTGQRVEQELLLQYMYETKLRVEEYRLKFLRIEVFFE